eukprot:gb/GECH01012010.1/.p1 GENE.gb/GECH01012010.1/~~gb/GECH01012010.1/.p1  ORF type:complete len:236 (+),score=31.34 gb/GECH01012010.1/:1-708(+)
MAEPEIQIPTKTENLQQSQFQQQQDTHEGFPITMHMAINNVIPLLISLSVTLIPILINRYVTSFGKDKASRERKEWLKKLKKPVYMLPVTTLGTLWTFMYLPQAVAVWMVYVLEHNFYSWTMISYGTQLALNATTWASLFYFEDQSLALLNLMGDIVAGLFVTTYFGRVTQYASGLMAIYVLYLIYMMAVMGWIWYQNEGKEVMAEMQGQDVTKKRRCKKTSASIRIRNKYSSKK